MLRKIQDFSGQNGYLDLRRSGIFLVALVGIDNSRLNWL
jgi:hypothetical protein